jgi:hypothetical protein
MSKARKSVPTWRGRDRKHKIQEKEVAKTREEEIEKRERKRRQTEAVL